MEDYKNEIHDTEDFRDKISTVDETGNRNWIYPTKPKGSYYTKRTILSWVLLVALFVMPFIKVGGRQFLLFNVLERQFVLFGIPFSPQDFNILVLAMISGIVFITLFTVIFGRLFCGWVCPQTIFMEMVFRKIEYAIEGDANAQKKLAKAPWSGSKVFKKVFKQVIFFIISFLIANVFLAYIMGSDELLKMISEPVADHWQSLLALTIFSFAFYFVFSYLREQVCVTICPYGRLQGVLLDDNSLVIAYDYVRGEPRGKVKKSKAGSPATDEAPKLGDCIDCGLCVRVCPTGIDIRNGTQLECINCTACIDACDSIMEKVDKPTGLIRYDSIKGIEEGNHKVFTPRSIAYSGVLTLLIGIVGFMIFTRSDIETLVLRAQGTTYLELENDVYRNLYNYQIYNKTGEPLLVDFKLRDRPTGKLEFVGGMPDTLHSGLNEGALFIDFPKADLDGRKTKLYIDVYTLGGDKIDESKTTFFAPIY